MALSTSTRAKRFIDNALKRIAECDGRGVDPYWETPAIHPMAEAKLLSAVAAYARAGLISETGSRAICTEVVRRLGETALPRFGGIAWGLNFPWLERSAAADEPYLITTSLVAIGLCDARRLGFPGGSELLEGAVRALAAWPALQLPSGPIPVYSPAIAQPIINTAAMWAVALIEAGFCTADAPLLSPVKRFLEANYLDGLGWRYGVADNIIDLVHNAYTLQAARRLFPDSFEAQAAALIGLLRNGMSFDDKVRVIPAAGIFELSPRVQFQIVGDHAIVRTGDSARSWSSGEILVTIADLADQGDHRRYWLGLLRLTLAEAVDQLAVAAEDSPMAVDSDLQEQHGALYVRHLTHVLHGFARALETIRRAQAQ